MAAGYFLIQHRRQLGRKYISKIRIWSTGEGDWTNPNMLFYVSDRDPLGSTESGDDEQLHSEQQSKRGVDSDVELGTVDMSEDGRNVVREYVVRSRL